MMNDAKRLEGLLDETRFRLRGNDSRATRRALRSLLDEGARAYPPARALDRLAEYAAYLYMALYTNLDDDEERGIEAAELAYVGLAESMQRYPGELYEITRHRILLLHRFADYLADSWMEVFMKKYKESHLLQARSLALDSLTRMLLADLNDLDRAFPARVDADDALNDLCNTIHLPEPPSDRDLADAALMHKVFHAYLKVKHAL
jgi:hypothetical protein